jgi:two-component system, response regulator PdtaR
MKVLIVDDEPLIRLSLSRAFKAKGHETFVAENGMEGEKMWRALAPDIIILDVLMPGLTGPQLIEKVKDSVGQGKIILISAYAGEYNIESAKKLGADLFIPKPFSDIFNVVNQVEGLFE